MDRISLDAIILMWKYARKCMLLKAFVLLLSALLPAFSVFQLEKVINSIVASPDTLSRIILMRICILILIIVAGSLCKCFSSIIDIMTEQRLTQSYAEEILSKYSDIDYEYFESSATKDIIEHTQNSPHLIIRDCYNNILSIAASTVTAVSLGGIFLNFSVLLAVGFFTAMIVMIITTTSASKKLNQMYFDQTEKERKLNYLYSLLSEKNSLTELKLFNAINYIRQKWSDTNQIILNERILKTVSAQKNRSIASVTYIAWTILLVSFIAIKLTRQTLSTGLAISLVSSVQVALQTSKDLSELISKQGKLSFDLSILKKFMNLPVTKPSTSPHIISTSQTYTIEFKNVSFTYPGTDVEVLSNVSFSFSSLDHIAIVGANGSGKSTIVKLLCKLYVPTNGDITINGESITLYSANELQHIIGVVFQDYGTYSLSLRENIALGNINLINDDIAINKALQSGLLDNLTLPLDTKLGKLDDGGIDLSGGQWQRVAIARASFANSAITILDEPTASLDPTAESHLYESFLSISKHQGCVIISHRLASARLADRIVVLDQGTICEDGTHEYLMQLDGLYAKMYTAQAKWYTKEMISNVSNDE